MYYNYNLLTKDIYYDLKININTKYDFLKYRIREYIKKHNRVL